MRSHHIYRTLEALDKLQSIQRYLRKQFQPHMNHQEAKANMDARSLVFRRQNDFLRAYGMEITKQDVEEARSERR